MSKNKLNKIKFDQNSNFPFLIAMSFQAYIDAIKAKTGLTTDDFKKLAEEKGLLVTGTTATQIFEWLKQDFDLGLGYARAIYALLKPHIPTKSKKK